MVKKIVIVLAVILSLSALGGAYALHWMKLKWQQPVAMSEMMIEVTPGMRPAAVVSLVAADAAVMPLWLKLWFRLHPHLSHIKRGSYKVERGDSLESLFARLVAGKEHLYKITLVEGETYQQWLDRFNKAEHWQRLPTEAELLKSWAVPHSRLDGLLLPETYHYALSDSVETILKRAYQAMTQTLESQWAKRQEKLPFKTPYEALILASIVEKESGVAHERPVIASVFINRLRKGMRLQTDPTVIYGMGDRYDGNIRRRDLRESTPYNTYIINGLPPTPIAMPSLESIHAVMHPADTAYLYFVATGRNGEHYFSKSLKEHNRAVRKYILKK